jgi:hypothetical protein
MGVWTAEKHHLLGSAQSDVRDELPAAAQVTIVLLAQHRRADPTVNYSSLPHRPLPNIVTGSTT